MSDPNSIAAPTAWELAVRPGFLIRRLHQIHLAMFAEECGPSGITPVQYSILSVAAAQPGLEQTRLGYEVGVDRTTLANVVARLEAKRLLTRVRGTTDRRLKHVTLTRTGADLLDRIAEPARPRPHHRGTTGSGTGRVSAGARAVGGCRERVRPGAAATELNHPHR
jgi:DNA-binding MarR family transcriptional regulator